MNGNSLINCNYSAFRTPPYQDPNIQSDVTVQFQLYRPSNQSTSEAKSFTYTPRERVGKLTSFPLVGLDFRH